MRAVTRAMLDDMPDPCDLHLERAEGRCLVMVGSAVLSEYAESDVVMRNFAVTTMRLAGFSGKRVAEVFGLSAPYVSTLHAAALRDGSRALVMQPGPGRPAELEGEALERARQWRAAGVSDREIGRRLEMAGTTVSRRLGPRDPEAGDEAGGLRDGGAAGCEPLVSEEGAAGDAPVPDAAAQAGPVPGAEESVPRPPGGAPAPVRPAAVPPGDGAGGSGGGASGGLVPGAGGTAAEGRVRSRYAGAMLLHAFGSRAGAGRRASRGGGRPACRGAAAGGRQRLHRAGIRHDRAVQAPAGGRGRAAGRAGDAAGPADPAARRWPASPTASTRCGCSSCSPPRCSPRTR